MFEYQCRGHQIQGASPAWAIAQLEYAAEVLGVVRVHQFARARQVKIVQARQPERSAAARSIAGQASRSAGRKRPARMVGGKQGLRPAARRSRPPRARTSR